ncbi:hypothetical protein Calab_1530 [Caldithrix abyssi DSM 13497]|uniref:Uncharacterized protein n=1 Tax=Caldithrix abyssi DSM 13497 TaxID=880073 RepID=H1XTC9_CALAY|nr:hypothetical protein [Caldithrix abyssi]APF20318.1 hypothetical protein Cabys_3572 [Caldithrix abyssi DSM 13497]EHO40362.1 hypothetical protein Calab_0723 [Caldithrix abyssi DSM 13497]EHO41150.1 hypothetical protein Calab_1530 [Caldithrix abyssi DSM 13497]
MAIIIHTYPKPTLTLSLKSGGDLEPNTTYYFTGFFTRYGGYYGSIVSPAADEVFITTTATERTINVNWGNFPDSTIQGIILKWDTQSLKNADGTWRRNVNKWTAAFYQIGFGGTNRDILKADLHDAAIEGGSNYNDIRFGHPELGWGLWNYPDIEQNFKFPLNQGKFGIEIPDDGLVYDWNDLINAILNSSAKDLAFWDSLFLVMLGGTFFGNGNLEIKGKTIIQIFGANRDAKNLRFENSKLICDSVGRQWHDAHANYIQSQLLVNGTALTLQNLFTNNSEIKDFKPFRENISYFEGMSLTSYNSLKNQVIYDSDFLNFRYPPSGSFLENIRLIKSFVRITISNRGDQFHVPSNPQKVYFTDLTFENYGSKNYDIDFTSENYVKNQTYNYYFDAICKNCKCDRPDGLILSYMKGPETWSNEVRVRAFFYYELEFFIENKQDGKIENAKIEIFDKEENVVFAGYTDLNGYVKAEILSYKTEHDPNDEAGNGLYSKNIDQNPFKIKITKSGYMDYEAIHQVYEKKQFQIALQPVPLPVAEKLDVNIREDVINVEIVEDVIDCEVVEC